MKSQLSLIFLSFFIVSIAFISCKNDSVERDMETFYESKISLPFDRMIKKDCSLYHDSVLDRYTKLVKYVEVFDCSDCQINHLSSFDNDTYNSGVSKNISILYIVNIPHEVDSLKLYSKLCEKRIRGTVYLDTCNAFLQANPHIPDNSLFHTFVLNEKDSVVLIGDPFKNEKMGKLFQKIIKKEQQRRKTDKMTEES